MIIRLMLILVTSLTVGNVHASPHEVCRDSYGQMFRRNFQFSQAAGISTWMTAPVAAVSGSLSVAVVVQKVIDKRRLSARANLVGFGGTAAIWAFFLAQDFVWARALSRATYAEVIANAMDELDHDVAGPATQTIGEFVRTSISGKLPPPTAEVFDYFLLKRTEFKFLKQDFGVEGPTIGQVQLAMRWMDQMGLLCAPDHRAIPARIFANRLAFSLHHIAHTSESAVISP